VPDGRSGLNCRGRGSDLRIGHAQEDGLGAVRVGTAPEGADDGDAGGDECAGEARSRTPAADDRHLFGAVESERRGGLWVPFQFSHQRYRSERERVLLLFAEVRPDQRSRPPLRRIPLGR
jgi:hypothetical protein